MAAPIVFFDIAGENDDELRRFYEVCFGWEISSNGKIAVNVAQDFSGAIRKDPTEKRIYIGVENIEKTEEAIRKNGGIINKSRFDASGVVVLSLFQDPAGNPMGLIEIDNGKIKVP